MALRQSLDEANALLDELRTALEAHLAQPIHRTGYSLYPRSLTADLSGDAVDVVLGVDWPVEFGPERPPPPWSVSARLIVKCDQQPPRESWCTHDLIDLADEVDSPEEAIEALRRWTPEIRDAVLANPASWITGQRHTSFTRGGMDDDDGDRFVPLLSLLEAPSSHSGLVETERADLVRWTLVNGSDYWAGQALMWVTHGVPAATVMPELLALATASPARPQSLRHTAKKLLPRT